MLSTPDSPRTPRDARIALFGTSRLHRPFARQQPDGPRLNYAPESEPLFMRMGYLHGGDEIAQKVEALVGSRPIPRELLPFVFRVENRATTPQNEFDSALAAAVRAGAEFTIEQPERILQADVVIVEISSLRASVHRPTGTALHTNPNFLHNVTYPAIYPDGYYSMFAPWLDVETVREDADSLADDMRRIRAALPNAQLIVMGHLASETQPQGGRLSQNRVVEQAALLSGTHFFDLAPFVDTYGWAEAGGKPDFHHLSLAGEDALGIELMRMATCLLTA